MNCKIYQIEAWLLLALLLTLPFYMGSARVDLFASGLFYDAAQGGFWLRKAWAPDLIHNICQIGVRVIAGGLIAYLCYTKIRARSLFTPRGRAVLFVLTVLLIGPGIVTNTIFKDFWGRARPYQVQEFGGPAHYTPPLVMADQCDHNCSFFSGDGALGFSLHVIFYLVPVRWRRRAFWGGWLGGGLVFGGNRLITGSHFLSDILFSGYFMLLVAALLHLAFYGWAQTRDAWRDVLCRS